MSTTASQDLRAALGKVERLERELREERTANHPTYRQLHAAMELCADDMAFFVRKTEDDEIIPALLLNDVFVPAADAERIPWEWVVPLKQRVDQDGWEAAVEWAANRRGQEPIRKEGSE